MTSPFNPAQWVQVLHERLVDRLADIEFYERYVDGDHDDPTVEQRASKAFRRILGLSKTNITGLIVETTAERLQVQGFRFGDEPAADADAWRIWQASDFDAESEMLISSALTVGRSFILVEPPQGDGLPRLYAESASQMIVAYAPGRHSERLAALKVWPDEWTGDLFATLYLPNSLHKFRARNAMPGAVMTADQWAWRDERVQIEPNPLGEVPVFELRTRPRLDGSVRSEIADVISDQDACNHIALNALIAAEYGAFRQKWATGLEVPRVPELDSEGNATGNMIPVEPFDVAVNRILISEDDRAKFGDFNATELNPYIDLYESRVKHMAAVSQTPVSILLGAPDNVAAESLALTVSGHTNKVKRRGTHYETPLEGATRLSFKAMGDPRASAVTAETIWKDPEVRSKSQEADAAVKLVQSGIIPPQQAQEDMGYSNTQRERMAIWARENAQSAQQTSPSGESGTAPPQAGMPTG